jgi:hypothetical protein
MRKEIDILIKAAAKRCPVVEKDSNLLWTATELAEARDAGRFQEETDFFPPDRRVAVSGVYPGCCQQMGASSGVQAYRPVGQTRHFIIFAAADPGGRDQGSRKASSEPEA